ncbi:hypothetical protein HDU86_007133 [Geranomyces michiganensis]|nr:hypothetical protein HDU86_007133 [Geranomyces michiganensis]
MLHVIAKLVIFSILLFALPITTYFASLDRLFSGNQNYSAIAAVLVANAVVFAYVLVAILEDQGGDDERKAAYSGGGDGSGVIRGAAAVSEADGGGGNGGIAQGKDAAAAEPRIKAS